MSGRRRLAISAAMPRRPASGVGTASPVRRTAPPRLRRRPAPPTWNDWSSSRAARCGRRPAWRRSRCWRRRGRRRGRGSGRRTRRAHRARRRRHVPAAVKCGTATAIAEPAGRLHARDDSGHQLLTAHPGDLRRRERCGHDRSPGCRMITGQVSSTRYLRRGGKSVDERRPRRGRSARGRPNTPGIALLTEIPRRGGKDRLGRGNSRGPTERPMTFAAVRRAAIRAVGHVGPLQSRYENG